MMRGGVLIKSIEWVEIIILPRDTFTHEGRYAAVVVSSAGRWVACAGVGSAERGVSGANSPDGAGASVEGGDIGSSSSSSIISVIEITLVKKQWRNEGEVTYLHRTHLDVLGNNPALP